MGYDGMNQGSFDMSLAFQGQNYNQMNPYGMQYPMQMDRMAFVGQGQPQEFSPGQTRTTEQQQPKKKPIILEQTNNRYTGRLKFFDESKGYGFIIMDDDDSDIFCHFDDFFKAGIDLNMLKSAKLGNIIRLSFQCLSYIGRHNKSRKAVDLQLLEN